MLVVIIYLPQAAMPLSSAYISTVLLHRLAILVWLIQGVSAFNSLYLASLALLGTSYGGVFLVTLLSQAFYTFLHASGSIILLLAAGYLYFTSTCYSTYFFSLPLSLRLSLLSVGTRHYYSSDLYSRGYHLSDLLLLLSANSLLFYLFLFGASRF